MIKVSGMLMIGSAGRNVGKTEFACSLIRRFSAQQKIVGIKVTTIKQKDGTCPRGGRGCGVCSSLRGDYCITEETQPQAGKDTSRLLASGASRVFWLRVMRSKLEEGAVALLDVIGPDAVSVCESNTLRKAVEPGLFVIVKHNNSDQWKVSAENVREYADRIISSDGTGFDADIADIGFAEGQWALREHAGVIVMAGGGSRRMKQDKRFLKINGRTMIEHVCNQFSDHFGQILVSSDDLNKNIVPGVDVVPDRVPGQGPLMGIASALEASDHDLNLVVACDMPEPDLTFARQMLSQAGGYDVVVPRTEQLLLEPLFAVYRKSVLSVMRELLMSGERRIRSVFDHCKVKVLDLPKRKRIINLNTKKEYRAYIRGAGFEREA